MNTNNTKLPASLCGVLSFEVVYIVSRKSRSHRVPLADVFVYVERSAHSVWIHRAVTTRVLHRKHRTPENVLAMRRKDDCGPADGETCNDSNAEQKVTNTFQFKSN